MMINYNSKDTIFARSSASGKAGISVFRISGLHAYDALRALSVKNIDKMDFGKLYLRKIYHPKNKIQIEIKKY